MKTVTHKGKEYQIGAVYEFSSDGCVWAAGALDSIDDVSSHCFDTIDNSYTQIRECQSPIGAINDAPIELEDGEAYQFEYEGVVIVGAYCKHRGCFMSYRKPFSPWCCSNIVKLVPEAK